MPRPPSTIEFAVKLLRAVRSGERGIPNPKTKEKSYDLCITAWRYLEEEAKRNRESLERVQRLIKKYKELRKEFKDHREASQ